MNTNNARTYTLLLDDNEITVIELPPQLPTMSNGALSSCATRLLAGEWDELMSDFWVSYAVFINDEAPLTEIIIQLTCGGHCVEGLPCAPMLVQYASDGTVLGRTISHPLGKLDDSAQSPSQQSWWQRLARIFAK